MEEKKKDRSDGSRDVRVDSTTSRDVRVGVSLAALIRGHRRLRHRPTTLHFFYTQTECFVECTEYIVFLHYIVAQCTGAADIVHIINPRKIILSCFAEVGIYKRKQESKKIKKTRFRPRNRSRKR